MHLLKRLCEINAVSGFEYTGTEKLKQIFDEIFDYTEIDKINNVTGYMKCDDENAPTILLEAHFDTIGLMVKQIHDGGFVSVVSIGGVDSRILPGSEVILHGKQDIFGIIGAKPPHIMTADESKKAIGMEAITVDTGYSKQQLEELIDVGTPISLHRISSQIGENKFSSGGLDNRAGIYTLLKAARIIKENKPKVNVCVLASVNEETAQFGAKCAASVINPDVAVVVDVTHGDTPDGDRLRTNRVGGGGVVCHGPNLSRRHNKILCEALEQNKIKYQSEVEEGSTGTNAWVVQTVNEGIPCVLISIPLKYMHTNTELLCLSDLTAVADSVACFINSLTREVKL